MLADHARTLDPFGKAAEELIEALPFAEFNPHVSAITPPQGVFLARGIPRRTRYYTQGQPYMIAGIAPATQGQGYRTDGILTSRESADGLQLSGFSLPTTRPCRLTDLPSCRLKEVP